MRTRSGSFSGDQLFQAENYSDSKSKYNDALKIKPEDAYALAQIQKITGILEQLAQDRLQREKLDKEYSDRIQGADMAFNNTQFEQAKVLYEQANTIKPEEAYPPSQIAKIDSLLLERKKSEEANQLYAQAVRNAQNAFDADQLPEALNYFKEAASYKPEEPLPKKRIPEIEALIAQREELARLAAEEERQNQAVMQAKQERYDAALANAQDAFDNTKYAVAKNHLIEALNIFPDEQYPKDRIARIALLIEQEAMARKELLQQAMQDSIRQATQLAFDLKMKKAEQSGNEKQYEKAIAEYMEAKELMPGYSIEVDQRIQQVRDKIRAKQDLETNYASAIQRADRYFDAKDWKQALVNYEEALAYKPDEIHPKERVRFIHQTMKELEDNYAEVIRQADSFFNAKDWSSAREKYSIALTQLAVNLNGILAVQ